MARKVIIDCDPGIDDAVALCLALFDPRLEVVAVTATAGNVSAKQASLNVQGIVDLLDPPRYPRIGAAADDVAAPRSDGKSLYGDDGLGNAGIPVAQHHHQHPSEKIIADEIRAAPDEITVICLGPLTNVALAFQRDPSLATMVDRLIMLGGSVVGIGNITPVAEFNVYHDPLGARSVFRSATTKTLIPLDVTRKVRLTMDLLRDLPSEESRAGRLLHDILPYLFRAYHQMLGQESVFLPDAVAVIAAVHAELFQTEEMAGDVETRGELTTGATIFDRRAKPVWRNNMEVATDVHADQVVDVIIRGLAQAGRQTMD